MTEHQIQSQLVKLISEQYPDLLYCATVGGARMSINQARMIKRQGYRKGVPDLIFYEPRGGYHGFCMEIKKKRGQPSPHQRAWIADLQRRGYQALICKGLDQCIEAFETYFNLPLSRTLDEPE